MPLAQALVIAREAALALDYAHRHGVVHRDVKPENILLHGGVAVVADFGIATALSAADVTVLTATGVVVGTPAYMSPEQVAAAPTLDGRSDVYSLGCVLFEMLTGAPPFAGAPQSVMFRRVTEPPPSATALHHEVPPAIDRLARKALATEARDRFATAAEFAEALARAAADLDARALQPVATQKSIAVLPFTNLGADPENDYFSDGISEDIINALANVPGLRVTARTSSFALKGATRDIREIGGKLDVETVLEGSVRRAGKRLRITAQLLDVRGGFLLWSDQYLQWALYAAGRYLESLEAGQRALEIAPNYVLALNVNAFNLVELGRLDEAEHTLQHALTLSPDDLLALCSLTVVSSRLGRRGEALEHLRRLDTRARHVGSSQSRSCSAQGYGIKKEHPRLDKMSQRWTST